MSSKRDLTKAGAIALTLALALIIGTTMTGILPNPVQAKGTLSILITDPPRVPEGVTAIYITYFDLEVHVSNAGNQSGWIRMQNQGSVELMGTVNVSQTLSSAQIDSGVYNMLRFNVSSALVTYNSVNYTAFVPTSRLFIPIIPGVSVNASQSSAVMIDITPTVINIGSRANPEFIIKHVAKAYSVPSDEVTESMKHPGFRMELLGKTWWRQLQQDSTNGVQITSVSLSQNSLGIEVHNSRNQSVEIRTVIVTPLASVLRWNKGVIPSSILNSATFIALQNGTLVSTQSFLPLSNDRSRIVKALFEDRCYTLDSGASADLGYTGTMKLSLRMGRLENGIVSGQQYLVTIIGDDALASFAVVAS
jgi:hypothetical protein